MDVGQNVAEERATTACALATSAAEDARAARSEIERQGEQLSGLFFIPVREEFAHTISLGRLDELENRQAVIEADLRAQRGDLTTLRVNVAQSEEERGDREVFDRRGAEP